MGFPALFFAALSSVLSVDTSALKAISRAQALVIAENEAKDRGVDLTNFSSPSISANSEEWSISYQCKPTLPESACHFLVLVDMANGAARMSASSVADMPPEKRIPESIQESVFAHEIGRGVNNFVVCIEIKGSKPSVDLLYRLSKSGATVVDASECVSVADVGKGSYHKPTGRRAIFFNVGDLYWIDKSHAMVEFESYHGGFYAEGATIFFESHRGKWVVTKRQSKWIS